MIKKNLSVIYKKIVEKINNKKGKEELSIIKKENEILIKRVSLRNKVTNLVNAYTEINEKGERNILPLSVEKAQEIIERINSNNYLWSDAFIFESKNLEKKDLDWEKSKKEHKYTSTGIKFWRHKESLESYKNNTGKSVISTHISPEGACNLKCPYCSVTYRDTHSRIPLEKIKNYVTQLKERGLKAVILTGGGEPTLYKHFNELVMWLKHDMGLSIGLITNGTRTKKINDETLKCFSWVRISINIFKGWEDIITFPWEKVSSDCIIGCSMVYTVEHEMSEEIQRDRINLFNKVSKVADNCGAKYIRVLPNCLLSQDKLILEHKSLQKFLSKVEDKRFFQQYKVHGAPNAKKCHQAYFRPYLSEEPYHENGEPGSVYPCDSVVLNSGYAHFDSKYQICKPEDIGKFMDKKINMRFDATKDCTGCVFTSNVNILDDWYNKGINYFEDFKKPLEHEEFV